MLLNALTQRERQRLAALLRREMKRWEEAIAFAQKNRQRWIDETDYLRFVTSNQRKLVADEKTHRKLTEES